VQRDLDGVVVDPTTTTLLVFGSGRRHPTMVHGGGEIGEVTGSDCHSTNPNPNYGREVVGEGEHLGERWWEKEVVWRKCMCAREGGGAGDEGMGRRQRSRRFGELHSSAVRSRLGTRVEVRPGSCAVREGVSHEWEAPHVGTMWRRNKRTGNKETTIRLLYYSRAKLRVIHIPRLRP
jgi:hypothetical protein